MTIGWIYRLSSVFALALVLNNSVLAAEWAIYRDGFQIPPLMGSDIEPFAGTAASRITPHSLLVHNGGGGLVRNNTSNVQRQLTEFGFYSGILSDGLEPKASELDEFLGPAGVFVRVRF